MRVVHPDMAPSASAASLQSATHSAAEVNEAYRVLVDPSRRFEYDRQRRAVGSAVPPSWSGGHADPFEHITYQRSAPRPQSPDRRVPWRGVLAVIVAAAIGVVVLSALARPSVQRAPDGLLQSGSCVAIDPNRDAREVVCTGTADIVVDVLVPFDIPCPQGTVGHRDRQGMGIACILPPAAAVSP